MSSTKVRRVHSYVCLSSHRVPPNCKFEVDDMEEQWTYDAGYFDYIHMRTLSGSFHDWESVLKNAY